MEIKNNVNNILRKSTQFSHYKWTQKQQGYKSAPTSCKSTVTLPCCPKFEWMWADALYQRFCAFILRLKLNFLAQRSADLLLCFYLEFSCSTVTWLAEGHYIIEWSHGIRGAAWYFIYKLIAALVQHLHDLCSLSLHSCVERSLVLFVLSICLCLVGVLYMQQCMFVGLYVVSCCVMFVHSEREMSRKAGKGRKWVLDLVSSRTYISSGFEPPKAAMDSIAIYVRLPSKRPSKSVVSFLYITIYF